MPTLFNCKSTTIINKLTKTQISHTLSHTFPHSQTLSLSFKSLRHILYLSIPNRASAITHWHLILQKILFLLFLNDLIDKVQALLR